MLQSTEIQDRSGEDRFCRYSTKCASFHCKRVQLCVSVYLEHMPFQATFMNPPTHLHKCHPVPLQTWFTGNFNDNWHKREIIDAVFLREGWHFSELVGALVEGHTYVGVVYICGSCLNVVVLLPHSWLFKCLLSSVEPFLEQIKADRYFVVSSLSDSKTLTEQKREELFVKLDASKHQIGWIACISTSLS